MEEGAGCADGGVGFVEDRGEGMEDVGRVWGHVEGDGDVPAGRPGGESGGVVEEDLVGPRLDEQRRQPGQVGEPGTDWGVGWVATGGVVGSEAAQPGCGEGRVGSADAFAVVLSPARVRSTHGDIIRRTLAAAVRPR